jgi:MOSC domain-containing protein YiiM
MVKTFLRAGRPGIYFAVVEEGTVGPGDAIELVHADENRVSVLAMLELMLADDPSPEVVQRVLRVPALAGVWREAFEQLLES